MLHQETQQFLNDMSHYSNLVVDKSMNSDDDQESCLEDTIIENYLLLLDEDVFFSSKYDDGQFCLEDDVIINRCKNKFETLFYKVYPNQLEYGLREEELKEGYECVAIHNKMVNSSGRGTIKMRFDTMALKNVFPPQGIHDNVFKGVVHEHVTT